MRKERVEIRKKRKFRAHGNKLDTWTGTANTSMVEDQMSNAKDLSSFMRRDTNGEELNYHDGDLQMIGRNHGQIRGMFNKEKFDIDQLLKRVRERRNFRLFPDPKVKYDYMGSHLMMANPIQITSIRRKRNTLEHYHTLGKYQSQPKQLSINIAFENTQTPDLNFGQPISHPTLVINNQNESYIDTGYQGAKLMKTVENSSEPSLNEIEVQSKVLAQVKSKNPFDF